MNKPIIAVLGSGLGGTIAAFEVKEAVGSRAEVQVVSQGDTTVWDTRTWGNPGAYCHVQDDGNFVVYRSDGTPLWDTRTWGTGADRLVLRDDGDLLLLDAAGRVLWRRG